MTTSLTAAAELMNGTETRNGRQVPRQRKRQAEQWQKDVWALRNESPEMRFLADRKARAVSQCRVYIGHHKAGDVGDPKRVDQGPVAELSQMLFGNRRGIARRATVRPASSIMPESAGSSKGRSGATIRSERWR